MNKLSKLTKRKLMFVRIMLNQGEYSMHRYNWSDDEIRSFANKMRKLHLVRFQNSGKVLTVFRKVDPETLVEKMSEHKEFNRIYKLHLKTPTMKELRKQEMAEKAAKKETAKKVAIEVAA